MPARILAIFIFQLKSFINTFAKLLISNKSMAHYSKFSLLGGISCTDSQTLIFRKKLFSFLTIWRKELIGWFRTFQETLVVTIFTEIIKICFKLSSKITQAILWKQLNLILVCLYVKYKLAYWMQRDRLFNFVCCWDLW